MELLPYERKYIAILENLFDELNNVIQLLEKVEIHGVVSETEKIIEIYDRIFRHSILKEHIHYQVSLVGKSINALFTLPTSIENGNRHIALYLNSKEIEWINDLYDGKLSDILKFFKHLFSIIENFSIFSNKNKLQRYLQLALELRQEVNAFLTIINQEIESLPADYKHLKVLEQEERSLKEKGIIYKPEWQKYIELIKNKSINYLYHFTDKSNLHSIKENGGLFSWAQCNKQNIAVQKYASNRISRLLDKRKGAENYVRLSFCESHPMIKAERNIEKLKPVVLKFSPDLIYHTGTKFCDRNAIVAGAQISGSLDYFKKIRFDLLTKEYEELDQKDRPFYSAEVLVFERIPLEYIINLHEF